MGNTGSLFARAAFVVALGGKSLMAVVIAVALAGAPALAQKAPAKKGAAAKTATKAPAKKSKEASAWVKLCDVVPFQKPPKKKGDKPEIIKKKICTTHFEYLHPDSGIIVVAAGIREVEGLKKNHLVITVPFEMVIPAGVKAKIDDDKTAIKLNYTHCNREGCVAETEATKEIIDKLKKGKRMVVVAFHKSGRLYAAPVPLNGFSKTLAGKPLDSRIYANARRRLMGQIRKRQFEKMKAARQAAAAVQSQAGATAPVKKKPAPKK